MLRPAHWQGAVGRLHHVERLILPGVVVIDLAMPRLGGIDAIKAIHAFDPSIRVVVITGEENRALHRAALVNGASQVLAKPVDCDALLRAVGRDGAAPVQSATAGPVGGEARDATHARRVLLAEEQPATSRFLQEVLRARGYETHAVPHVEDAIAVVGRLRPHAVVLGLEAPGVTGLRVLGALQGLAPRTPIIALSESSELARLALLAGAHDCIVRPIDVPSLVSRLPSALSARS